jgi:NAD(P) transhydrogenase
VESEVIRGHHVSLERELHESGVARWHGRGSFRSQHEVLVRTVQGERRIARADLIVIATGSHPRVPTDI